MSGFPVRLLQHVELRYPMSVLCKFYRSESET